MLVGSVGPLAGCVGGHLISNVVVGFGRLAWVCTGHRRCFVIGVSLCCCNKYFLVTVVVIMVRSKIKLEAEMSLIMLKRVLHHVV